MLYRVQVQARVTRRRPDPGLGITLTSSVDVPTFVIEVDATAGTGWSTVDRLVTRVLNPFADPEIEVDATYLLLPECVFLE